MKKLYIILSVFFLIVLSSFVSAVKINYYHDKINQDDCRLVLESIPEKYYEGIIHINFWIKDKDRLGDYWWFTKSINSYDNCSLKTLIEELAHHKNKMDGISFIETSKHGNEFKKAEEEIWQNLN